MTRLTQDDLRLLLTVLRELYSFADLDSFPARVLASLPRLIPTDLTGYNEVDLLRQRVVAIEEPASADLHRLLPQFSQRLHEHPLIQHYRQTHDSRTLKISDFLTQRQFHRLGLYSEFYRPLRVEHQLAVTLPRSRTHIIGIAFNRCRVDFSERDLLAQKTDILPPRTPLIVERAGARLIIRLVGGQGEDGQLLLLEEQHTDLSARLLETLGLTRREAEVLLWVIHGKTNAAIATILGMQPRTVHKHMERIYQKLGVETRTAAAMQALEALGLLRR